MTRAPVFDQTYHDYLAQIGQIDLASLQDALGFQLKGQQAEIAIFGRPYALSAQKIEGSDGRQPDLAVCVLLCKYLLMCPQGVVKGEALVTFKDFKDAAPLVGYFTNTIEGGLARRFADHGTALENACRMAGGRPYTADLAYAVKFRFTGLPRVPVYLLFNDKEEGFPAQATLLFERSAEEYLDMESLAILAGILVRRLKSIALT